MTSLKFLYFTLIFTTFAVHSQDTNIVKYFPLNVGNVWVYNGNASVFSQCTRSFYEKIYIDSVKNFYGKIYYKLNIETRHINGTGNCGFLYIYNGFYRVDSLTGNIFRMRLDSLCTYNINEVIIDSLKSKVGDTAKICSGNQFFKKIMRDTVIYTVLNTDKRTKNFEGGNFFEYGFMGRYAKDFGLIAYREYGMSVSTQVYLKGCIINGVIYGDTNYYYVSIQPVSNEIPALYKLNQNYPNPFNPETKIGFHIPKLSFVNIIIYDALGNEIETLLNENLSPGIYNVKWNASNYPSGVYFYKLKAGKFTETKKMVVIK